MKSLLKKIKFKYVIPISILILFLGYIIGTPIGALRFALFRYGYFQNSINLQISNKPYKISLDKNEKVYTLVNPPYSNETETKLQNWIVLKYGPIYIGTYGGW